MSCMALAKLFKNKSVKLILKRTATSLMLGLLLFWLFWGFENVTRWYYPVVGLSIAVFFWWACRKMGMFKPIPRFNYW